MSDSRCGSMSRCGSLARSSFWLSIVCLRYRQLFFSTSSFALAPLRTRVSPPHPLLKKVPAAFFPFYPQPLVSRIRLKATLWSWSISYQVLTTPDATAFSVIKSPATTAKRRHCSRACRCLVSAVRAWYVFGVLVMSAGLLFTAVALCVSSSVQAARVLRWLAAQTVYASVPTPTAASATSLTAAAVPFPDADAAWFAPVVRSAPCVFIIFKLRDVCKMP